MLDGAAFGAFDVGAKFDCDWQNGATGIGRIYQCYAFVADDAGIGSCTKARFKSSSTGGVISCIPEALGQFGANGVRLIEVGGRGIGDHSIELPKGINGRFGAADHFIEDDVRSGAALDGFSADQL